MSLKARIASLERATWGDQVLIVNQYVGMTKEDAVRLRFGPEGAPVGAELVVVVNGLPPDGVDYDWATRKGTAEYEATWEKLFCNEP